MSYIEWEYYSSLYSEVDESEFDKLRARAELRIDLYTHNRAKAFMAKYIEENATDFEKTVAQAIKITTCELINKISMQDSRGMGAGITSVSNDGYSESYKVTTESEKRAELDSVIKLGLMGTGLVGAL